LEGGSTRGVVAAGEEVDEVEVEEEAEEEEEEVEGNEGVVGGVKSPWWLFAAGRIAGEGLGRYIVVTSEGAILRLEVSIARAKHPTGI
jgi:hypothetical protein